MSLDKGKISKFDASPYKFAIVAARYNSSMVEAMIDDISKIFAENGVKEKSVKIVRVPGSAELPVICSLLAQSLNYDAIIALGVVIKGETAHDEIITTSTANALQSIAVETTIPVINGIIAAKNNEQALARTSGKIARGIEFAEAALEMAWKSALLLDELES